MEATQTTRLHATAPRPASLTRLSVSALWRIALGILAGFILGLDIVLACLIEQLLRATSSDDLVVPGVLHSGWNASRGVYFDLGVGAVLIFASCMLLGAACGWALSTRRGAIVRQSSATTARRSLEVVDA